MVLLLSLLSVFGLAACKPITPDTLPSGWKVYGEPCADAHTLRLDRATKYRGSASGQIKFRGESSESFATMMQMFKADVYRGKRLRLSAWLKTQNADSAQLWMRLDGAKSMLGFDNMDNHPVKGTTDWAQYAITLDVPVETVNIAFGAFLVGQGQLWMDDYVFEVVGDDVPTTNMLTAEEMAAEQDMGPAREYPDQPLNLNFEE
jgi:hypothetical protein